MSRRVMLVNAALSIPSGLSMAVLYGELESMLNLETSVVLIPVGLGVAFFGVEIALSTRRPELKRSDLKYFALMDGLWVIGSLALITFVSLPGRRILARMRCNPGRSGLRNRRNHWPQNIVRPDVLKKLRGPVLTEPILNGYDVLTPPPKPQPWNEPQSPFLLERDDPSKADQGRSGSGVHAWAPTSAPPRAALCVSNIRSNPPLERQSPPAPLDPAP